MFPVRMIFGEGDCLCAERAFHNLDADSVRRKRISRHGSFGAVARCADSFRWRAGKGLLTADHTVAVLEEVSYMVFDQPRHIAMLEKAYEHNLAEKIELLSSVPNYTRHPRASIEKMARHCRRVVLPPGGTARCGARCLCGYRIGGTGRLAASASCVPSLTLRA